MKIILFGPQGSGKGTQGRLLSQAFGIPHIDVGELLRKELEKGTELGMRAKKVLEHGGFVEDGEIFKLVKSKLLSSESEKGWILDGFPRTLEQADFLEQVAKPDIAILLKIPDRIAIKRLSSRRQCPKCGRVYGLDIPPKKRGRCDECGERLLRRKDDSPAAIRKRLRLYHKVTEPILRRYKKQRLVYEVDASGAIEEVFKELCSVVREFSE
ncbi:MAG: nucleoside monophosphate kinase [Candidatus Woesearchaeota archaeon]